MLPSIPNPKDYNVSLQHGFLPDELPLKVLPDLYYIQWENVIKDLQGLILSKRLRGVVESLPTLSTEHLHTEQEWRRAYVVLAFIAHSYVWGGKRPAERVPPPISRPFKAVCAHLELPLVATYAGVVLWNFKTLFANESMDSLSNLATLMTFTGSTDESWFYLVSVAIEARGAPTIPLMLRAMQAARNGDRAAVTQCLQSFAERLDEVGGILTRMYENCDPHVFYHRIRPYLAGSKNMADAGLPNGVIFDDGGPINKQHYVQYSGGSNAQSSIIQFFDLALGVEHRPTGTSAETEKKEKKPSAPSKNFIHDMRRYMPGPHARFLERVAAVSNIRPFVEQNSHDRVLVAAFDASLAMLRALRDKHIQMVSRYIIVKSHEAKMQKSDGKNEAINLAHRPSKESDGKGKPGEKKDLRGTGGTSLIPFLKQARDETGEPAIDAWARRLMKQSPAHGGAGLIQVKSGGKTDVIDLSGVWSANDNEGGLCHY